MSKIKANAKNGKEKYAGFWERNRKSGGYLLRRTVMSYSVSICRAILLFGLCFLILQPLLNKISVSFMTEQDLYDPIVTSIPLHFTTQNYKLAGGLMEFGTTLINSLVISLSISILQVAMCTLVGYGFARFKFPLKNFWFACVMVMVLIPPQVISTSLHLHFRFFDVLGIYKLFTGTTMNLKSSVLPYYLMSACCMGLKNGLYIYMIRQFFRNIPKELEEAAYVDGCGTLKTFIRIMLPDAKPILTSCFLFAFVWQWTDGFYSSMFLGNISLLSIKLKQLPDTFGGYMARISGASSSAGVSVPYTNCVLATGTLMVIVPLIVLYLFAQKGFVESLSSTGIKM